MSHILLIRCCVREKRNLLWASTSTGYSSSADLWTEVAWKSASRAKTMASRRLITDNCHVEIVPCELGWVRDACASHFFLHDKFRQPRQCPTYPKCQFSRALVNLICRLSILSCSLHRRRRRLKLILMTNTMPVAAILFSAKLNGKHSSESWILCREPH